jgi:hypothetical protein
VEYHLQAKTVAVDKAGLSYWATLCGINMSQKVVGITSSRKDVTCPKCKGKR